MLSFKPTFSLSSFTFIKRLFSRSSYTVQLQLLQHSGWGIDLDYCDIEWFVLEMNRDQSVVFEVASKYCISDSFVDHDGYSFSSKGFLPTVIDIGIMS